MMMASWRFCAQRTGELKAWLRAGARRLSLDIFLVIEKSYELDIGLIKPQTCFTVVRPVSIQKKIFVTYG